MKNILLLFFVFYGFAQANEQAYHAIILPGQNGLGGSSLAKHLLRPESSKVAYRVPRNLLTIDLGQEQCVKHFDEQFANDQLKHNKKLLLCGVSQGSATLINWLSLKSFQEQEQLVGCLTLEAVLGSPNNAVCHTAYSNLPILRYTPGSRLWLPLCAKALFPRYKPWGMNALTSADALSPNIPVIIMHNEGDTQLCVNDARLLYCNLAQRSDRVYYFEFNKGNWHFDLLDRACTKDEQQIKVAAMHAIYKKYYLPYNDAPEISAVDLAQFQPPIELIKKKIAAHNTIQKNVQNIIDVNTVCFAAAMCGQHFLKSNL